MSDISLTIPIEEGPLRRAAAMLEGLAEDLQAKASRTVGSPRELSAPYAAESGDTFTKEEIAEGDAQIEAGKDETPLQADEPAITVDPAVVFGANAEEPVLTTDPPPVETAVPTVELDGEGIPWDSRIHTSAKTKIKAGTWKLKRGVDVTEVEKVKGELLANMNVAAPGVTEEPVLTTEATVTTFPELVTYVTAKCNEGIVQQQHIEKLVNKHGITGGLPAVANRPDLIPAIYADMVALWPTTQG